MIEDWNAADFDDDIAYFKSAEIGATVFGDRLNFDATKLVVNDEDSEQTVVGSLIRA